MGLFDFLKTKPGKDEPVTSGSYFQTSITDDELRILVNRAITIIQNNPSYNGDRIIDAIKLHRSEEELAVALYRFIPNAFCRIIYPEPNYAREYQLAKNGKAVATYSFDTDRIFNIVLEESRKSFEQDNDQEKMVNILVHSSDFIAINNALTSGSQIEHLDFSPTIFPV